MKFQLAKMWPAFPGETKAQGPEHGETARDTPVCAIAGCGSCTVLVEAMIFCHATTLHEGVGH